MFIKEGTKTGDDMGVIRASIKYDYPSCYYNQLTIEELKEIVKEIEKLIKEGKIKV